MTERIQKLFVWLLLAPVVVPLIYTSGMLYPYLTPKTLLLRGLGVIAAALFVYLALSGAPLHWRRLREWMSWLPGALLAVAYATSLVGVDFYTSFWSSFERGDGLLTLTVIIVFFYGILLSADKTFLTKLYTAVAWVGSVVAVHALLQWLEALAGISIPFIYQTGERLGGTLGNAAFLASYLSLAFFATIVVARTSSLRIKIILSIGAALQLAVIALTATRGSLLALALIALAALIYISVKGAARPKVWARGALIAGIVAAGLFFAFRAQLSHSPIVPVARIASISLSDPTVSSRLFLWSHLSAAALPHALTGVGAEHITVLFDKIYDPGAIEEQWFDRSHDSFLDYFIQFGVFGFLLYVAMVVAAGYAGWRLLKSGASAVAGLALLAMVSVYAIQNIFVFDTAVVLWLLVAFFAAALAALHTDSPSSLRVPYGAWLGAIVGVAIAFLIIPVSIQPLRANLYLSDAYLYHVQDVSRSVDSMQKGFALSTYANLEYGYEAYQMYTGEQLTQLSGADLLKAYTETESVLETEYNRYPYDARTAVYFAHVLDSAPPGAATSTLLPSVLARAIALSPERPQPWYLKANIYIEQGGGAKTASAKQAAYTQALGVLKEYAAQAPTLAEPRFIIASLYLTLGDKASAAQWATEGLAVYKKDPDVASRAVKYYIAVSDWPHVVQFLQDIVDAVPTDYSSWYDLAKASYLSGDKAKALQIVAQLRTVDPALVESDQAFLHALGQ